MHCFRDDHYVATGPLFEHDAGRGLLRFPGKCEGVVMRKKSVTKLAIAAGASALALLVVACTDHGTLGVVKAGAERSTSERTLDPALNNLDGVTQHG